MESAWCGLNRSREAGGNREAGATTDAGAASFAIRIQYRGIKQTHELPLTTNTIGQLALEATFRGVTVGDLIADIMTAMVDKGLFQRVLDDIDPGRGARLAQDEEFQRSASDRAADRAEPCALTQCLP
jgi:hypothetical protein